MLMLQACISTSKLQDESIASPIPHKPYTMFLPHVLSADNYIFEFKTLIEAGMELLLVLIATIPL